MALLGTWTTLVPSKLIESRKLDWTNRRLIALAAGLLVGGVGLALAQTVRLDLSPQQAFFDHAGNLGPVYFGVLYTIIVGWSSLAARDRTARFRIMPVLATRIAIGRAHAALALCATRRDRDRRLDCHDRSTGQPLE